MKSGVDRSPAPAGLVAVARSPARVRSGGGPGVDRGIFSGDSAPCSLEGLHPGKGWQGLHLGANHQCSPTLDPQFPPRIPAHFACPSPSSPSPLPFLFCASIQTTFLVFFFPRACEPLLCLCGLAWTVAWCAVFHTQTRGASFPNSWMVHQWRKSDAQAPCAPSSQVTALCGPSCLGETLGLVPAAAPPQPLAVLALPTLSSCTSRGTCVPCGLPVEVLPCGISCIALSGQTSLSLPCVGSACRLLVPAALAEWGWSGLGWPVHGSGGTRPWLPSNSPAPGHGSPPHCTACAACLSDSL